jgi:hypothetical protein
MRQKKYALNLRIIAVIIIVFALLAGGGLFYWHEYRPAMIREACSEFAEKESAKDVFVYEIVYRHCLRKNGIEYYGPDGQMAE